MSVELNENSMGDLLRDFDVKRISSGDILRGQVIDVNDKEVTVNINYAFDTVYETKEYYEVVNKGKTHSSKGGTGYYIIVNIEDEEFRMKVEKVVYFEYEIGDNILLYKYNGALGYSYYEYQMNSIYIYNNE